MWSSHVVVPAVKGELALIDGVLHKGEGEQVAQGPVDRFFLTERALLLEVLLFAVSLGLLARGAGQTHPLGDEVHTVLAGLDVVALLVVHQRADAAAVRVPHDDDVLNLEMTHGVLNGRAGAVVGAQLLVGGHQVGHVAVREDLSGKRLQHHVGTHTGIHTRDYHYLGCLIQFQSIKYSWNFLHFLFEDSEAFLEALDGVQPPRVREIPLGERGPPLGERGRGLLDAEGREVFGKGGRQDLRHPCFPCARAQWYL
mmetsp:Transcript_7887/g.13633  ORF Transcript_7887/g.13633 Transcript_7887/m.13633 type:complete len:255 (+) Transcript_7887:366-1130(+)